MIRVGVIGYRGRMGAETCKAVEADDELTLAARIGRGDDLAGLTDAGVDVAVEFTTPDNVKDNIRACVERSVNVVVGTTGLSQADYDDIAGWLERSGTGVLVAPNFALGAVLMMTFAATAARFYPAAEIVERHHDKKLDAPSGTSLRTAALMSRARQEGSVPANDEASRGADVHGVRIHSLRLPGSVAHQEVIFGGAGETLTIRHDSLDRSSFMPGVLLAIKKAPSLGGLVVGLEHLLEL